METLRNIISSWTYGKYIPKDDKAKLAELTKQLVDVKYEKLRTELNVLMSQYKLTKKSLDAITKLTNELKENGMTIETATELIEETIKEIEDDTLESKLDMECDRYNKFTENNPAEHISYDTNKNRYTLDYDNERTKSKELNKLIDKIKKIVGGKKEKNIITPLFFKKYNDKIISYNYDNIELFDINHMFKFLNYDKDTKKYYNSKKYITFRSIKNNKIGGFYIKEYIERDNLKYILLNCRKHKLINFFSLIDEKIHYKMPIEIETLKPLYEIFSDYNPILQYKIDKYYIDLYLQKVNIAIECDENNHMDRKQIYELDRENLINNQLKCIIIRYNPDEENFNINIVIKKIMNEIINKKIDKQ
jgi:very-short-patch-repair endonuclease